MTNTRKRLVLFWVYYGVAFALLLSGYTLEGVIGMVGVTMFRRRTRHAPVPEPLARATGWISVALLVAVVLTFVPRVLPPAAAGYVGPAFWLLLFAWIILELASDVHRFVNDSPPRIPPWER